MLARAMGAEKLIGVDVMPERCQLARDKRLAESVFLSGPDTLKEILDVTGGKGVERAIDCSGHTVGRQLAIRATCKWGRIALVGEGGTVEFNPSPDIIHDQKTIFGSWVTSIWKMEELVSRLVRWGIHPEELVTHRFSLDQADEAYRLMAEGRCGKVAVVFD
jgi:threonine dehydrogenase-like Zn-dependent dehydrogenase